MSGDGSFDPSRLPDPEVQDPDVSRDVDLGTAAREDFTAPDTAPVADLSVETLLGSLESDSAPERRRAILALAEREGTSSAREALASVAGGDPDSEARQFAIEALAKLGADPETIRIGLEDPDPWVRAETIVSLKKTAASESVATFETSLEDPHAAVRRNALISLHHVRGQDTKTTLVDALSDEADRVREWAVRLLGTMDEEDATQAIVDAMDEEDSEVVREAAARALDGNVSVDADPTPGGDTVRADDHVLNRMPDS